MTSTSMRPSTSSADDSIAAIRTASARFLAAVDSRDVSRITAVYADDAAFLVPNAPGAFGREAVGVLWGMLLGAPGLSLAWSPTSIEAAHAGDMAFEIGSYTLGIDGPDQRRDDVGKYVVVWKRVDGAWRVAADMFNSDLPPRS